MPASFFIKRYFGCDTSDNSATYLQAVPYPVIVSDLTVLVKMRNYFFKSGGNVIERLPLNSIFPEQHAEIIDRYFTKLQKRLIITRALTYSSYSALYHTTSIITRQNVINQKCKLYIPVGVSFDR